jgi:GNAT superfamily N-acetyltransferase
VTGLAGLRRAGPSDADAVRAFTRASYAHWVPVIGREPRPMVADYDLALQRHWIDVVQDDAGIAALIEMVPAEDHLLIENIAVRRDRQGEGLGALLLRHAEEVARSHGFSELRLYTNLAFTANVAYYPRRGFSETGRSLLPDGGTMVHFARVVS